MMTNNTSPNSQRDSSSSRGEPPAGPKQTLPRRRWRLVLFALGTIAVLVVTGMLIAGGESQKTGPTLTHTVTCSDLLVTVTEQGVLESAENTEIKCQVRGQNTVLWVIESGTFVEPGDELVRLNTFLLEEQIDERTKYALWSRSGAERSAAVVASAELTVAEYEQGTYVAELLKLVSPDETSLIQNRRLVAENSPLRKSEILMIEPRPHSCQRENHLIDTRRRWSKVGRYPAAELRAHGAVSRSAAHALAVALLSLLVVRHVGSFRKESSDEGIKRPQALWRRPRSGRTPRGAPETAACSACAATPCGDGHASRAG